MAVSLVTLDCVGDHVRPRALALKWLVVTSRDEQIQIKGNGNVEKILVYRHPGFYAFTLPAEERE